MRRHAALVLLVPLAALLLSAAGCEPPPVAVAARDRFFSPATATAGRGQSVRWTNEGNLIHTTTGASPLNLWSKSLNPDDTFTFAFVAAGTYAYLCTIHFGMSGTVKVPIAASPGSGSTGTTFTVTVASQPAASGFQYVVQKKNPGGSFATFKTITAASTTFQATAPGTYQFRAQLKRTSNGATSGFSDPVSVSVS